MSFWPENISIDTLIKDTLVKKKHFFTPYHIHESNENEQVRRSNSELALNNIRFTLELLYNIQSKQSIIHYDFNIIFKVFILLTSTAFINFKNDTDDDNDR